MDEEEINKFHITSKGTVDDVEEGELIEHEDYDYEEGYDYKKCLCKDVSDEEEYICECLEEEEDETECICEEDEEKKQQKNILQIELLHEEEVEIEEEQKEDEDEKYEVEEEELEDEEFLTLEEEKIEKVLIDREALKAEYNVLMVSGAVLKKDNESFHKKLASYFKRKRMEHALHDVNPKLKDELCRKLEDKLKTYEALKAQEYELRIMGSSELDEMKITRKNKYKIFIDEFSDFLHREKEVATGLKSLRNGQELPEKTIDRFINRQITALESLAKNRVLYLKAKHALLSKIEATKKLEVIGPGLTLAMYEQIMLYHATTTDKIQEKTAELEVLRTKCNQETGILGHIREKLHVTYNDIKYNEELLDDLADAVVNLRQYIANHCINKDEIRKTINKLKFRHALLLNKELLCDMYNANNNIEKMKEELIQLKDEHFDLVTKVSNLRQKRHQHHIKPNNKSNKFNKSKPCKKKTASTVTPSTDCRKAINVKSSPSSGSSDANDIYASTSTHYISSLINII